VYNLNSIEKFKSMIKLINFEKQSRAAQAKRLVAAGGRAGLFNISQ
jgi:hypothetical protein